MLSSMKTTKNLRKQTTPLVNQDFGMNSQMYIIHVVSHLKHKIKLCIIYTKKFDHLHQFESSLKLIEQPIELCIFYLKNLKKIKGPAPKLKFNKVSS